MALSQAEVTVGMTATELVGAASGGAGDAARDVWLRSTHGGLFFVGGSDVSVSDGYPVRGEREVQLAADEALYAVVEQAGVKVRVLTRTRESGEE